MLASSLTGPTPARALLGAGVTRLDQVARIDDAELPALHGVGPKAVRILRGALREREGRES
ncbi:hypothetical protein [Nesterenkonia sp. F]|uniref:hypothetical protein n=1 Tax=Nesterenkonia sp. F TaxID=795955 RepID=UPI000255D1C2|nr:hypothetical protein [Nesterenkonia sp. F]